jgi:hypothetical protein
VRPLGGLSPGRTHPPSRARRPGPADAARLTLTRRKVKNNRLNAAGYTWAFSALTASPGARARYDRRRDDGDRHAAAQRNLFGRLLGCLHRCLTTGQDYDETIAFPATAKKLHQAA